MFGSCKKSVYGSITVFACLTLLTIISFLLIVIQACCVKVGIATSDRRTLMSVKAVMSEYNTQIFDNYHILVMDGGNGNKKFDYDYVRDNLSKYSKVDDNEKKNFIGMDFDSVADVGYTFITDNHGELFEQQIVEYMKYKVGKNFVEQYIKRFDKFSGMTGTQNILKKKQKVSQSSQKMSEKMMELMSYIDGIKVKKGNLVYDKSGELEFEDCYVKMIVYNNDSMELLGITNKEMYKFRHYHSIALDSRLRSLENCYIRWLKSIEDGDKEKQKSRKDNCKRIVSRIEEGLAGSKKSCKKAINVIDEILDEKKKYDRENKKFRDYLQKQKNNLSNEVYNSFIKESEEENELVENLPEMKKKLERNLKQLEELEKLCKFKTSNDSDDINESLENIKKFNKKAEKYIVSDLVFDYGELKLEKEPDSFVNGITSLLQDGAIALVTDEKMLSRNKLTGSGYPSKKFINKSEKTLSNIIEDAINGDISAAIEGLGDILDNMTRDISGIEDLMSEGTDKIIKDVLVNQYIEENFLKYQTGKKRIDTKETAKKDTNNRDNEASDNSLKKNKDIMLQNNVIHVLEYEEEYILFGNKTDMANIKAMVSRLLKVRTMCNLISIMSDSTKRKSAHEIAVAVFGFTGMPVIINLATVVIEIVWAYEESLVDVSALLKGYGVPLIKGKTDFIVQVYDLLKISKSYIMKKSEIYAGTKKAFAEIDYVTYIEMFLLIEDKQTKLYRCMDLIQANINNTYGKDMRMENCIFGMDVSMKYISKLKYINFKFMKEGIGNFELKRIYESKSAYCY